jgi:hypothetical protein
VQGGLNAFNTPQIQNLLTSLFGGGSIGAANNLMSQVNQGLIAPDAGGTPYVPLPGTDSSLNQGEVG